MKHFQCPVTYCITLSTGVLALAAYWVKEVPPEEKVIHGVANPDASCGPVSLALIGHWLGKPTSLGRVNDLCSVGSTGTTSLLDLKIAARRMGLDAEAVRLHPTQAIPWELPTVLHLNSNHFVAALPMRDGGIVMSDPPENPKCVDKISSIGDWEGIALVVARSKGELDAALDLARIARPTEGDTPP